MDKVAALPDRDRQELFEASASELGVHPAIIEKDFWVCWVLKHLFASEVLGSQLVFKGGTSLSKVYHLIKRFSEDIDLVLNWELLGYRKDRDDPWEKQASNTKQDVFNKAFNKKAAVYISEVLQPHLAELLSAVPEVGAEISTADPGIVNIAYPAAFDLTALRPEVKLEIGPLASWVPSDRFTIEPYAAETHGAIFDNPACPVVAILAERSFWEKATILHQQAHRASAMPPGYSRHYYDLFHLAGSPVKERALTDLKILADVVLFKQRFYPCAWARDEEAKPGSFRLMPTEVGARELEADYHKMRAMIFEEPPTWEEILAGLKVLEYEINSLKDGARELGIRN